jgi:hypothetical protein
MNATVVEAGWDLLDASAPVPTPAVRTVQFVHGDAPLAPEYADRLEHILGQYANATNLANRARSYLSAAEVAPFELTAARMRDALLGRVVVSQ